MVVRGSLVSIILHLSEIDVNRGMCCETWGWINRSVISTKSCMLMKK